MDTFDVSVDASGARVLVRPSGELDVASAPTLWSALAGEVTEGRRAITLDLSRLTFSDCAGLRPIRRALRQGTDVELRDALPAVRLVLDLTGLGASPALT